MRPATFINITWSLIQAEKTLLKISELKGLIEKCILSMNPGERLEILLRLIRRITLFSQSCPSEPEQKLLIIKITSLITPLTGVMNNEKLNAIITILNTKELPREIPELKMLFKNLASSTAASSIIDLSSVPITTRLKAIVTFLRIKEGLMRIPELKTLLEKLTSSTPAAYQKKVVTILQQAKDAYKEIPEFESFISQLIASLKKEK